MQRHQNVGRLDVAVDDSLLMGVLYRAADVDDTVSGAPGSPDTFVSQYSVIGMPLTSSITK